MKIGFSFSRCVRDIAQGNVDINDVLIVISRTDLDPRDEEQWQSVWTGYRARQGWSAPEWIDFDDDQEDLLRDVAIELYESGRLHQPRQFDARLPRFPYTWLEATVISSDLEKNPAVKDAWNQFQTVAGLSGINTVPPLSRF
jgi:hypothetical protein